MIAKLIAIGFALIGTPLFIVIAALALISFHSVDIDPSVVIIESTKVPESAEVTRKVSTSTTHITLTTARNGPEIMWSSVTKSLRSRSWGCSTISRSCHLG